MKGFKLKKMIGHGVITLAFSLIMGLSFFALAEVVETGCANGAGITVTGKDGYVYCKSKLQMNWWSAYAWCDAINKRLISFDRCHGQNNNIFDDSIVCPNFALGDAYGNGTGNVSDVWTATNGHYCCNTPTSSYAIVINLNTGGIRYYDGSGQGNVRVHTRYALCE